ncbi:MAG: hypothetical protein H6712_11395 [Myxococcales bacterium]|nr:hypothetical protein [Myxococcales bacterium]MCB9714457.1 hypothetical protein [Myxococcales bacterium]
MTAPIQVLVCYVPGDEPSLARLEVELEAIGRSHPIEVRAVPARAPARAPSELTTPGGVDVLLVLVSPRLAIGDEPSASRLRTLGELAVGPGRVVPILLEPTPAWTRHPELGTLAALPDFATAITDWVDEDGAWAKVGAGLRRLVEHLATQRDLP